MPRSDGQSSRYWQSLISAWPELGLLPDDESRQQMIRLLRQRFFARHGWFYLFWVAFVALMIVGIIVTEDYASAILARIGAPAWLDAVIVIVLTFVLFYAGLTLLWQHPMRRFLRAELQRRGIACCLGCGYDCRSLSTPRCPECGKPFDAALLSTSTARDV
ncbi:MAG: hypothetical protein AB7Q17_15245 [Phycisphaerae bacterium]